MNISYTNFESDQLLLCFSLIPLKLHLWESGRGTLRRLSGGSVETLPGGGHFTDSSLGQNQPKDYDEVLANGYFFLIKASIFFCFLMKAI